MGPENVNWTLKSTKTVTNRDSKSCCNVDAFIGAMERIAIITAFLLLEFNEAKPVKR